MNAAQYAKGSLEHSFNLLNTVMQGMEETQYNWSPNGTVNAIAKTHVHAVTATDFFINMMIKGGQPKWGDVASKHNLPQNPLEIWKHEGPVPLAAMTELGQSVQKEALDYVASLKDEDLDREIETNFFGKQTVAWILQLAGTHTAGHAGDMAAAKGMQGLKGLPF